jgi:Uma2 family endonuclease
VETAAGLMTFAEFEKLPDPPAGHYELHHGQVVLMPPRKKGHFEIQLTLFDLLAPLLRGLGRFATEFPFRPAPEYESWQDDLGFVRQTRWEADRNDYFLGAPDFVIEVLSPSNTMDEMLDRQAVCFEHGCVEFWTVDPKRKIVMVTTPDRRTITYDQSGSVPVPFGAGSIEVAPVFLLPG